MLRKIVRFIEEEKLFYRDEKLLVAVSGGVDSVVLLHLLKEMEVECSIAHCNFHLRGAESDGDFEFVKDLAEQYEMDFYAKDFDTKAYAEANKISIEMAARDLRYNWFAELCDVFHYRYIAVGHHADDVLETVFINLARGTGIHGLTGIKPKNDRIVRPLLSFTREQILGYAKENHLQYREDSTNQETDYVRNKIRHQVMPVLQEINPGIRHTMTENVQRFREVEQIYNAEIEKNRKNLVIQKEDSLLISIAGLKDVKAPVSHLYEIISPFGFHQRDVRNIVESIYSISGKRFYSATHEILRDREYLILSAIKEQDEKEYWMEESDVEVDIPVHFKCSFLQRNPGFKFSTDPMIATFDANLLQFPLKIRKWKEGDTFQPIGMKGKKKISDYFIDQKFSLQEKENTWLLLSGNRIIWIPGHRMDDRFKITDATTKIYRLELR
ncbi:tRNA lysidine(34) synthetase TilS [Ancylomarina longa]|uniref:tRNA(Ile)-lysidine synthase n=1 Tax=Ancylomarina longa TaxID=2487017 RepID=A0A434AFY2_9BACT|nr:tRNA lysidine(34) synthetase TilS [Ancylomarina longa]RUT73288.1 tRNA lysidine(34) synthetase TilS [Ancylomarina longa]